MVVDPGTGAYYADRSLRDWLASRAAHNGPNLGADTWPQRLGPFLWAETHEAANLSKHTGGNLEAESMVPAGEVSREIGSPRNGEVLVSDFILPKDQWRPDAPVGFTVRWQFAPDSRVEDLGQRRFRVTRHGVSMEVQVSADWAEVWCVMEQSQVPQADPDAPLAGMVSPAFRKTVWAPYLKLVARSQGDKSCVFSTAFLALESPRTPPSVQSLEARQQG